MINITTYSLKLVKEDASRYDLDAKFIRHPRDIATLLRLMEIDQSPEEQFLCICLNTKHKVVGVFTVSHGSLNSSIVHPREVFKRAVLLNSAAIILAHNHPSGDPSPSKEDVTVTQRLAEGGKLLGIEVLDHIIIGDGTRYTSLKEENLL